MTPHPLCAQGSRTIEGPHTGSQLLL